MAENAPSPSIDDLLVHRDFLCALARRLAADEATASDVEQEVWLRALEKPPAGRQSLTGWIARVARNLVRDRAASEAARGRRERERSRAGGDGAGPGGPVAERLATFEHLGSAFAALPSIYREALYLRYYEDLGPRTIAGQLGSSVPTVKTRLRRGLQLLREDLERRLGAGRSLGLWLMPLTAVHPRGAGAGSPASAGGLVMTKKLAAAAVLALASGGAWIAWSAWAGGRSTARSQPPPEDVRSRSAPGDAAGGTTAAASRPTPADAQEARRAVLDASTADAPLAGRVAYAATGQGVPYYRFRVGDPESSRSEWIETEEDGSYRGEVAFGDRVEILLPGSKPEAPQTPGVPPPGADAPEPPAAAATAAPVSAEVVSASRAVPRPEGDARLLARADTGELLASPGPTYFLDFEPPEGYAADGFEAAIVGFRYESLAARRAREPVHAGRRPGTAWVRFERPDELVYEDEDWVWQLELVSTDGAWVGKALVPWVRGVWKEPVHVELARQTSLSGSILDTGGRPLPGITVRMQEEGGERTHHRRSDAEGRYLFELLEPGTYVLYVRDDHHVPWKKAIALPGGPAAEDITLTPRPPGGPVRGRVTSATGSYREWTFLFLEGEGDQDVWRRHDVEWKEENGVLVGEFAFDDIGDGNYRLTCNTIEGVPIHDRVRRVSPGETDVLFHIEDDRPVLPLEPRVLDADTGATIDSFHFLSRVEGGYLDDQLVTPQQPLARVFREGVDFEWWVRADGYRPRGGTARDVPGDGALEVRVEPGFGAVVHVVSVESLSSVPGVTVFADGEPVGVTGDQGDLVLDLPSKPRTIGFDPERWWIYTDGGFHSDIDPKSGAYDLSDGHHLGAYLRRVQ